MIALAVVAAMVLSATVAIGVGIMYDRALDSNFEGSPNDRAEVEATSALRDIHAAQRAFIATCGGGGYAPSLDVLAKAGASLPNQRGFMPSTIYRRFGRWERGTYVLELSAATGSRVSDSPMCNGLPVGSAVSAYVAIASPEWPTGHRYFMVDAGATMFCGKSKSGPWERYDTVERSWWQRVLRLRMSSPDPSCR